MRISLENWVLTATLLIAVVLLLRGLFGRRVGARLRYALWALVLARLLIPVQLYTAPVEMPQVLPEARVLQTLPLAQRPPAEKAPSAGNGAEAPAPAAPIQSDGAPAPAARSPMDPAALLGRVWLGGSLILAAAFVLSNVSFAGKLRRRRIYLAADCPVPAYTAAGLPSPCLFGFPRPAVYVTPEAAADPAVLRHVLTHEATHYRHGDHIWALLRCAALAVHWWNPLVWLAAVLSRRDAELACDEGALSILGDGERRAYGGTLLTLVTAKPGPGDLLRCATTMTGDKRSLRERVGRIAHAPKRWLWAAALSAVLAGLVCACSFAGTETPEAKPDGPLTEAELTYFNTEVFNGEDFNLHNQFLFLAVESPKDYKQIDLFQLFYNGTGAPMEITEEERRAVAEAAYQGQDPGVDLIKCPAAEMDAVLREYAGLGLEETDKWCLDRFTYLAEYDAYYHFHGDTNYPGEVTFTSGERKDGKILLYYEAWDFPGLSDGEDQIYFSPGPACVTLEEQADGGFRFLTNWRCDPPAQPTAYPAWDPELVIPLDGLSPYEPEAVEVSRHSGDVAESLWRMRFEPEEFSGEGFDVEIYRSTDGTLCAAVAASETERDCFLTVPAADSAGWTPEDGAWSYTELFGRNGAAISYYGQIGEHAYGAINDYYVFSDSGTPSLLLRALGNVTVADLDGDGEQEVAASDGWNVSRLFFQRDGTLYEADLYALMHDAWPEAGYMEAGFWDPDARCLFLSVEVPLPGSDVTVSGFRTLWFDGENLRLYRDEGGYTDHVSNGIDAPAEVVSAAKDFAQAQFQALAAKGYGWDGSGRYDEGNAGEGNVVWDDWRVTGLSGPYYEAAGNVRVEIWQVGYETHTTTPERVMLAGGSYMGEDGWCLIGYPGSNYQYFRLDENGRRTYLFSRMENDCAPGSEMFLSDMVDSLIAEGVLTLLDLDGEELAKLMYPQSAQFLNALAERNEAEQNEMLLFLAGYLSCGSEKGNAYYEGFTHELDAGGYLAGELTSGGRAAWETLRDFVNRLSSSAELEAQLGRVPEMTLPELLEYLGRADGAYAERASEELLLRFQADPSAVLSALAERAGGERLAENLGASLYWNEDLVPGALEQALGLRLDGEEAAMRDRIASAYEAKRQEVAA